MRLDVLRVIMVMMMMMINPVVMVTQPEEAMFHFTVRMLYVGHSGVLVGVQCLICVLSLKLDLL